MYYINTNEMAIKRIIIMLLLYNKNFDNFYNIYEAI